MPPGCWLQRSHSGVGAGRRGVGRAHGHIGSGLGPRLPDGARMRLQPAGAVERKRATRGTDVEPGGGRGRCDPSDVHLQRPWHRPHRRSRRMVRPRRITVPRVRAATRGRHSPTVVAPARCHGPTRGRPVRRDPAQHARCSRRGRCRHGQPDRHAGNWLRVLDRLPVWRESAQHVERQLQRRRRPGERVDHGAGAARFVVRDARRVHRPRHRRRQRLVRRCHRDPLRCSACNGSPTRATVSAVGPARSHPARPGPSIRPASSRRAAEWRCLVSRRPHRAEPASSPFSRAVARPKSRTSTSSAGSTSRTWRSCRSPTTARSASRRPSARTSSSTCSAASVPTASRASCP